MSFELMKIILVMYKLKGEVYWDETNCMCIDFEDDKQCTMFLLKTGEIYKDQFYVV